jgi:hypothetical protein
MTNLRWSLLLSVAILGGGRVGLHAGEAKTGFVDKVYKGGRRRCEIHRVRP